MWNNAARSWAGSGPGCSAYYFISSWVLGLSNYLVVCLVCLLLVKRAPSVLARLQVSKYFYVTKYFSNTQICIQIFLCHQIFLSFTDTNIFPHADIFICSLNIFCVQECRLLLLSLVLLSLLPATPELAIRSQYIQIPYFHLLFIVN